MSDYPDGMILRPIETWRTVIGFPDYEVSDQGRVRRATGGKGVRAGRILVAQDQPNGYFSVMLYRAGIPTRRTIHTLVYEAFVGPRPRGLEVNHLDGNKANNSRSNLEGCTSSENKQHASENGLSAFGLRNASTKLRADQVRAIIAAVKSGASQRATARQYGISQGHVSDIVNGKRRQRDAAVQLLEREGRL